MSKAFQPPNSDNLLLLILINPWWELRFRFVISVKVLSYRGGCCVFVDFDRIGGIFLYWNIWVIDIGALETPIGDAWLTFKHTDNTVSVGFDEISKIFIFQLSIHHLYPNVAIELTVL